MNEQTTDTREKVAFEPEKIARIKFVDGCAGSCECGLEYVVDGDYVDYDDYAKLLLACKKAEAANREKDGVLNMAVARLGGLVEGRPTARLNFLQRVDELVAKEAELASLRASVGEKSHIFWPCADGFHADCAGRKWVECGCPCHKLPAPPTKDKE